MTYPSFMFQQGYGGYGQMSSQETDQPEQNNN